MFFGLSRASGQDVILQTLAKPGDSRPIQLYADEVATWADAGKQVFLLKGTVRIEQGTLNVSAPRAVVWVDQGAKKDTGVYDLQVYAENVTLENGSEVKAGKIAVLQLGTRGEVRIKSYVNKAVQKAIPGDPLYVRATGAVRAGASPPALLPSPLAGVMVKDGKAAAPAPLPPLGGAAPLSAAPASDPNIQLTQAVAPAPVVAAPIIVPVPPADGSGAAPSAPPPPLMPPIPLPSGTSPPVSPPGSGGPKKINIRPRFGSDPINGRDYPLPTGETAVIVNSGVIVTVTDPITKKVLLDIEADRFCMWIKGTVQDQFGRMRSPEGETTKSPEFYLSGNVEIRNQTKQETEIIRADEVYYDVNRNVAVAIRADLEIRQPTTPNPIHFKAQELLQLNSKLFQAKQAEVYSTVLPSDPGLKIQVREAQIEEIDTVRKSIFGRTVLDRKTGQPLEYKQRIFSGEQNVIRLEGVPIAYFPYLKADVERPLGPLDNVNFSYNKIFGFQIFTTWDMYELLGLQRPDGNRWKLFVDGMTVRGPALGTEFNSAGRDLLGIPGKYEGMLKLYAMYDGGLDVLGGNRGQQVLIDPVTSTFVPLVHPAFRGRIFGNLNDQEMPLGFSVQAQFANVSDQNYLEQFFPNDYYNGPNQDAFLYVKQQNNIWAWSVLASGDLESWMTTTSWLPKADGYVLGYKLFDLLTYNVHGSAGYGVLRPTENLPFAFNPTDQRDATGRFDLWQDVSLPFALGAFKVVPYLTLDLAEYTQDETGAARGRFYGGGGVRASIPFSRLYPDAQSDIFNVDGIFHKIVLSGNYYVAHSDTPLSRLPQLDRLNDNTSDQALRDVRNWQPLINPTNALNLTTSPLFNPQIYNLRRLVDTNVDSLDSIQVLQLDLRQRWQTKRGFPGQEHVIDWMTLDVQASLFPNSGRDNFGRLVGDIEYDWLWNIGDRTALVSNGWFEPIDNGPRVFNVGAYIKRPDRTSFYLGYRQIDPLLSKAVLASVTYAFSAKYALTFGSNFDFGNHIQSNSLMVTRIGTDLTFSLGLSYSSIVKTFGVQFEIVPNLLPGRAPGAAAIGAGGGPIATR